MQETHPKISILDRAYALETPADSRRLYADWAETYDQSFARAHDYQAPSHVAAAYKAAGGIGPVLDVGAGTGLCGQALVKLGIGPVDATDISREMLNVAERKRLYRKLFAGDLNGRLPVDDAAYEGVVSSGTFTCGHVGPAALEELLRITHPGGLLVLSINRAHYRARGFEAKLRALRHRITDLRLTEHPIYGAKATGPHRDDTLYIAQFRRVRG
ncbi:class I SAM-dependent methyltransferase [Shimia sp.]|uniref:class I SAM-dependent DNA methyltransferase n=1 Tax=Shimia sp. TaxID=1954381 RepID=UPI003569F913